MCNWRERGEGQMEASEASTSPRCPPPCGPTARPGSAPTGRPGAPPPRPPSRRPASTKGRSAESVAMARLSLKVEDPANLGRSRDVPELDDHFRGDLAWAVPAKLEYYEGTRLPVRGWFQSCEDCGRLTGRSKVDNRGHEYFHCRECELQERRRIKRDLLTSGPIVIPATFPGQKKAAPAAARPTPAAAPAPVPAPADSQQQEPRKEQSSSAAAAAAADQQQADEGQPTMRDLVRVGSAPVPAAVPAAPPVVAEEVGCRMRGASKAKANLWLSSDGANHPSAAGGGHDHHPRPPHHSHDTTPDGAASRGSARSRASSQTSGWTESPDTVAPPAMGLLGGAEAMMLSEIVSQVELKAGAGGGRAGGGGLQGKAPLPHLRGRGHLSKSDPNPVLSEVPHPIAEGEEKAASWVPQLSWELAGCMWPLAASGTGF